MLKRTKKIKVRKSDDLRALLTDTLPYETPLLFSNSGYYWRLKKEADKRIENESNINFFDGSKFTVPFSYSIIKDHASRRTLSITHPAIQTELSKFYQQYAQLIIGLTSRSRFSIRKPKRVASRYFEKSRGSQWLAEHGDIEIENFHDPQEKNSSSYFAYEGYGLIHRFLESSEFQNLERRFHRLRSLDISKCFPHIYTHSISWAVKDKDFAKDTKRAKSFDTRFDELMRWSNHDETNGIVVGPETSRIFAEIILQRIDQKIERALDDKNLVHNRDYSIRRYVDDYFIFANSDSLLDEIQDYLQIELEKYKLYLNEAKTRTVSRPFCSERTIVKNELSDIVERLFQQSCTIENVDAPHPKDSTKSIKKKSINFAKVRKWKQFATIQIRNIKSEIYAKDVNYDGVTNHFFGTLRRKTAQVTEHIKPGDLPIEQQENLTCLLLVILEIAFFMHAMSPRARTTIQISQLCFLIHELAACFAIDNRETIRDAVAEKVRETITRLSAEKDEEFEYLNLLTLLGSLGERYLLAEDELMSLFRIQLQADGSLVCRRALSYFQAMTLLHYMGNKEMYEKLREFTYNEIFARLTGVSNYAKITSSAELSMLFIDTLSCPYVSSNNKVNLAKEVLRFASEKNLTKRSTAVVSIAEEGDWFYGWRDTRKLGSILWKRELRQAY